MALCHLQTIHLPGPGYGGRCCWWIHHGCLLHLHLIARHPTAPMASDFAGKEFGLGILVGCVVAAIALCGGFAVFLRTSDVYSLGHWKLNLRTPIPSMWMNLGYWYADVFYLWQGSC